MASYLIDGGRQYCGLLVQAVLAAAVVFHVQESCAQPVGHPTAGACPAVVDAGQVNALATVTVRSECRRGSDQPMSVLYEDDVFLANFDDAGTARVSFALLKPARNEFKIRLGEEPAISRSLDVPEFATVKRVTLTWQAPVRLMLHVVEPGSRLHQVGSISEEQPNQALTRGRGAMDLAGGAPKLRPGGRSTTSEQSYVLANDDRRGVFSYYVEYASQGANPAPPFCGDNALATVQYRLMILEGGVMSDGVQHETARLPCGQPVTRLQRRID